MPANLTPDYIEAEHRFRTATTHQEKLAALEEMLALLPKHKGTEKMHADLKRRLAKLRQEEQKKSSTAKHKPFYQVDKEGAGQVVLIGPPNAGKSSLLARLTHAEPQIADYPFTTRAPLPGMMPFENIQIQLVDTPPLARGYTEPWVFGLVRNADAAVILADLGDDDLLSEMEETFTLLEQANLALRTIRPENIHEPALAFAHQAHTSEDKLKPPLFKPAVLVGTKLDLPNAADDFELLKELVGDKLKPLAVSTKEGSNLETLKQEIYRLLGIIRVYTKQPGKKPDFTAPFVLKHGSAVLDVARTVHRDFALHLKYARIWGTNKFDGQMVHRDHVLEDGDVIELHV
jgi:hypothetical protein